MFCSKCGNVIEKNATYCNKCGFNLKSDNNIQNIPVNDPLNNNLFLVKRNNKNMVLIGIGGGVGVVVIILLFVLIFGNFKTNYYFSDNSYTDDTEAVTNNSPNNSSNTDNIKKSKGTTVIISDNVYNGVSISNIADANKLISKDSTDQKNKCPKEILKVENEMISKYGITAVNLCEMDIDFAKELESVFGVIYEEYPEARGHITNLTLRNTSMITDAGVIAAFMPVFNFATSNTSTTYPWIIKTQILLSSTYFLNKSKLEASVNDGSSSGHFPPNSTLYSPVAHELGHYLSFLAMMNNYDMNSILLVDSNNINTFYKIYDDFAKGNFSLEILKEAYNNYIKDINNILEFDEWRGTISQYALAKNNNGEYIYDETIAEAFHDVYLNSSNASDASKYIVAVLKQRLRN